MTKRINLKNEDETAASELAMIKIKKPLNVDSKKFLFFKIENGVEVPVSTNNKILDKPKKLVLDVTIGEFSRVTFNAKG